jgi:phage FluMu protein Com
MTESELQKYILEAFRHDSEIKLWRRNVGAVVTDNKRFIRFGIAGMSDLEGIVKELKCPQCGIINYGVHIEIELKGDGGKLSVHQKNWLEDTARYNGIAVLIHPERNDPIGLRERVLKMLIGQKCPQCVSKASFERKD